MQDEHYPVTKQMLDVHYRDKNPKLPDYEKYKKTQKFLGEFDKNKWNYDRNKKTSSKKESRFTNNKCVNNLKDKREPRGLRPENHTWSTRCCSRHGLTPTKEIGSESRLTSMTTSTRYHKREREMVKKSWPKNVRGSAQKMGQLRGAERERDRDVVLYQDTGNRLEKREST